MSLARKGYGSVIELNTLDTDAFLDLVEFEQMTSAIERHQYEEASNGHS